LAVVGLGFPKRYFVMFDFKVPEFAGFFPYECWDLLSALSTAGILRFISG